MMFEINVCGKTVIIRFGMHLAEMLGAMLDGGKKKVSTPQFVAALIAYGHENYCMANDIVPLVTYGQVFSYLEDNANNQALADSVGELIRAYTKHRGITTEDAPTKGAKKKLPATKS